ncbi:Bystin [Entamoeba marina]
MKGLRKHTSKAMDEPANKARVALGQEMEDVGKVKQSRRQKVKKVTKDVEEINQNEKNKIISSAMQQLKEDKMEVEYDINQLDDNAMEIEYENEMEEEVESDSEDNADNLEKEYDVAIDEESLQLLEAFKNDVEVADVNSMITSQLNLIKKKNPKLQPLQQNQLGVFLSHYHVGRMPRVFKLLPSFEEWAELLQLTNPATWTPHSLFAATKLFIHSTSSIAEKFMNTFLLPIIRNSMHKTKKLHFQEYLAVKRCIYQPAAFFKGIIFPLCQTNDVTFKEATIIASILQKVSIPAKHSAVALYKLSTIPYNSTQGLFMKTLLDKKYSLPYAALDAVVNYFLGFMDKKQNLPLLWHQSLLVLVQRYVKDFKPQQITQLQKLCQVHKHHAITSVVIIQLQKSHN